MRQEPLRNVITRGQMATSFYLAMPGVKVHDYNEFDIIKDVAHFHQISEEDMKSQRRLRELVQPRQIAMYLMASMLPSISYVKIGELLGGRNHATVVHAVRTVKALNFSDKNYCYNLKALTELIESHILRKTNIKD